MNERTIERHSVNCYFCNTLFDERNSIGTTPDGGDVCEDCEDKMYYKVTGSNRLRGAIGKHEPFTEYVTAESPVKASEKVREIRYNRGYEHVHIRKVERGSK